MFYFIVNFMNYLLSCAISCDFTFSLSVIFLIVDTVEICALNHTDVELT